MTSLVPSRFEELNQRYNKICYLNEENSLVNINVIGCNFRPSLFKSNIGEFLEFVIYISFKALERAKRYDSTTYDIHFHLENCSPANLNVRMCKYIYTEINKIFEDTARKIFVYTNSNFAFIAFKLIKSFLERETLQKLQFIKNN
jgi:hypothetical protein